MASESMVRFKLGNMILPVLPSSISISGSNSIVKLGIPGKDGEIIQHLGGKSRTITFSGTLFDVKVGNTSLTAESLQNQIIEAWRSREPLEFVCPLIIASPYKFSTKVLVDNYRISDTAGRYRMFDYSLTVVEYDDPYVGKIGLPANLVNSGPLQDFIAKLKSKRLVPRKGV